MKSHYLSLLQPLQLHFIYSGLFMLTVMGWKRLYRNYSVAQGLTLKGIKWILFSGQRNFMKYSQNEWLSWMEGGLVGSGGDEEKHNTIGITVCATVFALSIACLPWCRRPGGAWQNTTCYPERACLEESGWNPQLDSHGSERQRKRPVRHLYPFRV